MTDARHSLVNLVDVDVHATGVGLARLDARGTVNADHRDAHSRPLAVIRLRNALALGDLASFVEANSKYSAINSSEMVLVALVSAHEVVYLDPLINGREYVDGVIQQSHR